MHFINVCRIQSGYFSCAIDCFLEIWVRILSMHFIGFSRSYIIRLLGSVSRQIKSCVCNEEQLSYLRSDIWDYMKIRCPSFTPMDCNAQFSEIFQKNVFADLNSIEQSEIISTYSQEAFCSACTRTVQCNTEVFINYIRMENVVDSNLSIQQWPSYILFQNMCEKLQCDICQEPCDVINSATSLSELIFVEFNHSMMNLCEFESNISLLDNNFELCAMVRHSGSHFTFTVKENNNWCYIDLQDVSSSFRSCWLCNSGNSNQIIFKK